MSFSPQQKDSEQSETRGQYARDATSRAFLGALEKSFTTCGAIVRTPMSAQDVLSATIASADDAFSALPMPVHLRGDKKVARAAAAAHSAHLDLLRAMAARDPLKSEHEASHTQKVAKAHARYANAAAKMRRLMASDKSSSAPESDVVRLAEMVYGSRDAQDPSKPWVRGDIAAAADNGDYALVLESVMNEFDRIAELRTQDTSPESVVQSVPLYDGKNSQRILGIDVDPELSTRRRKDQQKAIDAIRIAMQRGLRREVGTRPAFEALVQAAEKITAHELHSNPDSLDGYVTAAVRCMSSEKMTVSSGINLDSEQAWAAVYAGSDLITDFARAVRDVSSGGARAITALYAHLFAEKQTRIDVLVVRQELLKKRMQEISRVTTARDTDARNKVFDFLEQDVAELLVTQGTFFYAELDPSLVPDDLARAESTLEHFKALADERVGDNNQPISETEAAALVRAAYIRNLQTQVDETYRQIAALRSNSPDAALRKLPDSRDMVRSRGALERAQRKNPNVHRVVPVEVRDQSGALLTEDDARAALDAVNNAVRSGDTLSERLETPPGNSDSAIAVDDATEPSIAVDTDALQDAVLVDARDYPPDFEYRTSPATPLFESEPVPALNSPSRIVSEPTLKTLESWRRGFKGSLTPVDVELYMLGTGGVKVSERLAYFPALVEYARTVGTLYRTSPAGISVDAPSAFGTDADAKEFLQLWDERLKRRALLDGRRDLDAGVEGLVVDLANFAVDQTPGATREDSDPIIFVDVLPPVLPDGRNPLRERILYAIDTYVQVSHTQNLDAAYRLGDALSYMYASGQRLEEQSSLRSVAVDPAIRGRALATLESDQLTALQSANRQMMLSHGAPASEQFRTLVGGADLALEGNARVSIARRIDGALLDEKFAGKLLDLQFSKPDMVERESGYAQRILSREKEPVSRSIVRIERPLSNGEPGTELFITDTLAHVNPDTLTRMQIIDRESLQTLTVRVIDPSERSAQAANILLGSVALGTAGTGAAIGAAASVLEKLEEVGAARIAGNNGADTLAPMSELFSKVPADVVGEGGLTKWLERAFARAMADPVANVSDVLRSAHVNLNWDADLLNAHSIAFAHLQYLVDLFTVARAAGGFVVRVLMRISVFERAWRATRDALLSTLNYLRSTFVWATISAVITHLHELATVVQRKRPAALRRIDEIIAQMRSTVQEKVQEPRATPTDANIYERLLAFAERYLPRDLNDAAIKSLEVLRVAVDYVPRLIAALAATFGAVSPDGAAESISATITGVLNIASVIMILYVAPTIALNFSTFAKVWIYRAITRYVTNTALNGLRAVARARNAAIGTKTDLAPGSTLALVALLGTKIAPWISGRQYPAVAVISGTLGAIVPFAGRAFDALMPFDPVTATMPAALAGDSEAAIQLTAFAARAAERVAYQVMATMADSGAPTQSLAEELAQRAAVAKSFDDPMAAALARSDDRRLQDLARESARNTWKMIVGTLIRCDGELEIDTERAYTYDALNQVATNFIGYVNKLVLDDKLETNLAAQVREGDLDGCFELLEAIFGADDELSASAIEACSKNVDTAGALVEQLMFVI